MKIEIPTIARRVLAAACLLAAPACAFAQSESEARAGYDAAMRRFEEFFKRGVGDPAGLSQLYTEGAIFVLGDGQLVKGRDQLGTLLAGMFADATIKDFTIETSSFHSDGRIAYAGGLERMVAVSRKSGKEETEALRFLVVLRQQPNKQWLLDYGMETPAPAKAKPPK